ncbi:hypothetical protein Oweho_3222 [Owenweeksia hongkongensis DSM 17368]|uniref:Uncharacterized protein n=2 Tax=Owenweeksia TaxID=267986 RepID=G8R3T6_OWEHD|nr:hypothetical protein Oweho_3222 [Owenweeksia hongkongensis DSM 17368]
MVLKNVILWMVALAVPLLATLYFYMPSGPVLYLNGHSLVVNYPDSWDTFTWMLSLLVVPALVAITLLFTLSRSSTPWQVFAILLELLILMMFNIDRLLARQQYVDGHSYLTAILITSTTVAAIMLLWKKRQKTEREKKEALLYAIDQLTKEDLPAIFSGLMDIEMTTDEMKETDFVWAIKKMLKQNLDQNKIITAETINKLTTLKTSNK